MTRGADADALIVGAGIQGATLAWEMALRGLRAVLVDRAAPGSANTAASFGLLHGGLRYLQSFDLQRWVRSRREQAWFAATMPALVQPLAVAMPLYRGSLRSPALFRAAFAADRLAAAALLPGTPPCAGSVATGHGLLVDQPLRRAGMIGVARWQEYVLSDATAAVQLLLQRAGAPVVHGEPRALLTERGRVVGLEIAGPHGITRLSSPMVVLCAGAGTRALARRLDRDRPSLSSGILAFNLLLDVPPPRGLALGVSPAAGRGRSLFVRAEGDRSLAGTWYAPWPDRADSAEADLATALPPALLEQAIGELRACLPTTELSLRHVCAVRAGRLPDVGGRALQLRDRDVVVDHGAAGGPAGLWSVLGVKLTTARALSSTVAARIWPGRARAARTDGDAATDTSAGWTR